MTWDVGCNVFPFENLHARLLNLTVQKRNISLVAKISVKKISFLTKHSLGICEKSFHRTITMRRFNIDYRAKTSRIKSQCFSVPLDKWQPVNGMSVVTELNGGGPGTLKTLRVKIGWRGVGLRVNVAQLCFLQTINILFNILSSWTS